MEVTKIKPIRGTVNKALAYILDPQKTDDAFYVSSYGCAASDAAAKEACRRCQPCSVKYQSDLPPYQFKGKPL